MRPSGGNDFSRRLPVINLQRKNSAKAEACLKFILSCDPGCVWQSIVTDGKALCTCSWDLFAISISLPLRCCCPWLSYGVPLQLKPVMMSSQLTRQTWLTNAAPWASLGCFAPSWKPCHLSKAPFLRMVSEYKDDYDVTPDSGFNCFTSAGQKNIWLCVCVRTHARTHAGGRLCFPLVATSDIALLILQLFFTILIKEQNTMVKENSATEPVWGIMHFCIMIDLPQFSFNEVFILCIDLQSFSELVYHFALK